MSAILGDAARLGASTLASEDILTSFDAAVGCLASVPYGDGVESGQVSEATQEEAVLYLERVASMPDVWTVCLDRFCRGSSPHVRFYALSLLVDKLRARYTQYGWEQSTGEVAEEAPLSDPEVLVFIRDALVGWLDTLIASGGGDPSTEAGGESAGVSPPSFFLAKVVQLLTLVFKSLYVQGVWSSSAYVEELLLDRLGSGQPVVVAVFLMAIQELDETTFALDLRQSAQEEAVGSALREEMSATVVPTLFDALGQILSSDFASDTQICASALNVLARLLVWVDASYATNTAITGAVYGFLDHGDDLVAVEAARCLCNAVSKGMDAEAKCALVETLNLEDMVSLIMEHASEIGVGFLAAVGRLVAATLDTLASSWFRIAGGGEAVSGEVAVRLQRRLMGAYELILVFATHPSHEITTRCVESVSGFLGKLARRSSDDEEGEAAQGGLLGHPELPVLLARTMDIILARVAYGEHHDFERPNGLDEQSTEALRDQLVRLWQLLGRLSKDLAQQWFMETLEGAGLAGGEAPPWPQTEALLLLFYAIGEVMPPPRASKGGGGGAAGDPNEGSACFFYHSVLSALLGSGVASHQHLAVKQAFFDVLNRYAPLLSHEAHTAHVPMIVATMMDERGLLYAHSGVAQRFGVLLVKLFRQLSRTLLGPYAQEVLNLAEPVFQAQACMHTPVPTLPLVLEAMGVLLGEQRAQILAEDRVVYVQCVLQRMMSLIESLAAAGGTDVEAGAASDVVCNYITALASFAKGFPPALRRYEGADEIQELFQEATACVVRAAWAMNMATVRSSVLVFLHTIVKVVGTRMMDAFVEVSRMVLQSDSTDDLLKLLGLATQMIGMLREACIPFLTVLMDPLTRSVFAVLRGDGAGHGGHAGHGAGGDAETPREDVTRIISDEDRDRDELRRACYALVQTMCARGVASDVFGNPETDNAALLPTLLDCNWTGTVDTQRSYLMMIKAVIQLWIAPRNPNKAPAPMPLPGLDAFLVESLIPFCLRTPLEPWFSFHDARAALMVVSEMARVVRALYGAFPALVGQQLAALLDECAAIQVFDIDAVTHQWGEALAVSDKVWFEVFYAFLKEFRGPT